MAISKLGGANKWVELATSSPTSGSTVTFSSLPSYKDYRIEWFGLTNSGGQPFAVRFNNDSGSNYAYLRSGQSSSAASAQIYGSGSQIQVTIFDADSISKTIEGWGGTEGEIKGFWNNQTAINRIDIIVPGSYTYTAGTIKIYGRNR